MSIADRGDTTIATKTDSQLFAFQAMTAASSSQRGKSSQENTPVDARLCIANSDIDMHFL
jgi:hypothetical protein